MLVDDLIEHGIRNSTIVIDGDKITYNIGGRGKTYMYTHPEERIRAVAILSLIFEYGYMPSRIQTEVEMPRRVPDQFADIVVFRDDARKDPYITIEVAAPDLSSSEWDQKVEQLFGNANVLKSTYGFCFNGKDKRCWKVEGHGGLERAENVIEDIPKNYGNVAQYLYKRNSRNDLKTISLNDLSKKFRKCHDVLWSGGKLDPMMAFDEISKMLFAKLFDELQTQNDAWYKFQNGHNETDVVVANRIREIYQKAQENDEGLFNAKMESSDDKIAKVVKILQDISLCNIDPDAKGRAYEQFLGEVFRGRLGQYFTRRELVKCMIDLVHPTHKDVVLDPACGSGGFLIHVMQHVYAQIDNAFAGNPSLISKHKVDFAQDHMYGIEISDRIARISMMGMVIYGDGHTNIENDTAFNSSFVNDKLKDGNFDLILTNPPFGDKVSKNDSDKLGQSNFSNYVLCTGKTTVCSEILYIERCTKFLKKSGRLGIVLPDGVLSNPTFMHVRKYLLDHYDIRAIISLPAFAFRKAGAGMKTSLLFAEKRSTRFKHEIFMSMAEHIGYDSTGRPDLNDFTDICKHYHSNTGDLDDRIIRVGVKEIQKSSKLRLDPFYYLLKTKVNNRLNQISYPKYTLDELTAEYASGKSPDGGATYSEGDIPILIIGNIADDGTLDLKDVNRVDGNFYSKYGKNRLMPLNILIAKDGATTGKVGLVNPKFNLDKCLFNEHIFRYKIKPTFPNESVKDYTLNSHYVFFFLRSALGQDQIRLQITGGGQTGITKGFGTHVKIPMLPIIKRQTYVKKAQKKRQKYLQAVNAAERHLMELDKCLDLT